MCGVRNGKIDYLYETTDLFCTYYYADSKEEALEEYNKTHVYEGNPVYHVAKITRDVFKGITEDMLIEMGCK